MSAYLTMNYTVPTSNLTLDDLDAFVTKLKALGVLKSSPVYVDEGPTGNQMLAVNDYVELTPQDS